MLKTMIFATLTGALLFFAGCSSPSKQTVESEKRAAVTETTVPGGEIEFKAEPSVPKAGSQMKLTVVVRGSDGKVVSDAQVNARFIMAAMPSMNMQEMRKSAELTWDGSKYQGVVALPSAGDWNLTVQATRNNFNLVVYHSPFKVQ